MQGQHSSQSSFFGLLYERLVPPDHLLRRIAAADQATSNTYRYYAFGSSLTSSGSTTNPYRYVGNLGYYNESALGLQYLRARWYDPAMGRFLSRDRLGQDANRYAYARNRPTLATDPSGLKDIMFTFDDGPDPADEEILNTLKSYNIKAGLFWVGDSMISIEIGGQQLVKRALQEGHILGNHSASHSLDGDNKFYSNLSEHELEQEICLWEFYYWALTDALYGDKGYKYWRAPAWNYNQNTSAVFTRRGYSQHCGADIRSGDATLGWPLWGFSGQANMAWCLIRYLVEAQPQCNPCVIGWHDKKTVAPHTPEAIGVFLKEIREHPTLDINVIDYIPNFGVAGEPVPLSPWFIFSNC